MWGFAALREQPLASGVAASYGVLPAQHPPTAPVGCSGLELVFWMGDWRTQAPQTLKIQK